MVLMGGARRIISELGTGDSYDAFRFAVLAGTIFYNITESAFCGLTLLWVVLLLAIMKLPRPSNAPGDRELELEAQCSAPTVEHCLPAAS